MAFTVEHVKSLLQGDLVTELEKAKMNIIAKHKYKAAVLFKSEQAL